MLMKPKATINIFAVIIANIMGIANANAQERVGGLGEESAWIFAPMPLITKLDDFVRFKSSDEASALIDEIMSVTGLPPRFEVYRGPVGNAAARIENGIRVIYYSENWISQKIRNDRWQAITLLAHEIGHHLSAHTLKKLEDRRLQELEADRYAGFIVAKLDGTLADAQRLYLQLPEKATRTHPSRYERLEAVATGWRDGQTSGESVVEAKRQTEVNEVGEVFLIGSINKDSNILVVEASEGSRAAKTLANKIARNSKSKNIEFQNDWLGDKVLKYTRFYYLSENGKDIAEELEGLMPGIQYSINYNRQEQYLTDQFWPDTTRMVVEGIEYHRDLVIFAGNDSFDFPLSEY